MSRSRCSSSSMVPTGLLLTVRMGPPSDSSTPRTTWFDWAGGGVASLRVSGCGSAMSRPFCASGVTTMKMISSTSMTSIRGVMLISETASTCLGRDASCECTTQRRCFLATSGGAPFRGGSKFLGGFPNPAPTLAPLRPRLGDERDLFHARLAQVVHHLHHLGVGQLGVRLEEDHLAALGRLVEPLLHLGHHLRLVHHDPVD